MSKFEKDFLEHYLRFGLGSMPKSDIDALVMHLLDKYGINGDNPLCKYSNQTTSETLKTPASKIKKLRYEAALKFGGRVEDQAVARLLTALSNATLESDGEKVCLIIEDSLAKNWLQGKLKIHQQIFDHSFNTEILKVEANSLFHVLSTIFDSAELNVFQKSYETAKKKADMQSRKQFFKTAAKKFAEGAAKKAGEGVMSAFKAYVGTS